MKKVAKLVLWSPMTRVVVGEDATYEQIVEAARSKFRDKLNTEYEENVEDVIDDLECPAEEGECFDNYPTHITLTREDLKNDYEDILPSYITFGCFKESSLNTHQYDRANTIFFIDDDGTTVIIKGKLTFNK